MAFIYVYTISEDKIKNLKIDEISDLKFCFIFDQCYIRKGILSNEGSSLRKASFKIPKGILSKTYSTGAKDKIPEVTPVELAFVI